MFLRNARLSLCEIRRDLFLYGSLQQALVCVMTGTKGRNSRFTTTVAVGNRKGLVGACSFCQNRVSISRIRAHAHSVTRFLRVMKREVKPEKEEVVGWK